MIKYREWSTDLFDAYKKWMEDAPTESHNVVGFAAGYNAAHSERKEKVINKKDLLSSRPIELGVKDAVHVAIVSVRAGCHLSPGQRCTMNEYGEAIHGYKDAIGVVSPFLSDPIMCGEMFWMMLFNKEVPNVKHHWEHKKFDFAPPTREVQKNKYLERYADQLGITYQQLLDACAYVVENDTSVKYEGSKTEDEVTEILDDCLYDIWCEWADEANYEFDNEGTYCCPEPVYPYCNLFYWGE